MNQLDHIFFRQYFFDGGLYICLSRMILVDNNRFFQMKLGPEQASKEDFKALFSSGEFAVAINHFNEAYEGYLRKRYPERFVLVH